jgi:hypothetical protein
MAPASMSARRGIYCDGLAAGFTDGDTPPQAIRFRVLPLPPRPSVGKAHGASGPDSQAARRGRSYSSSAKAAITV